MEQRGEDTVVAIAAERPQPLDALWRTIMELFREERPTEAQMREVMGVASLALVATLGREHAPDLGPLRDVADCASLYAFRLGYHHGQQANART